MAAVFKQSKLELKNEDFVKAAFVTALNEDVHQCAKIPSRCVQIIMSNGATNDSYSFSEAVCEIISHADYYAFVRFFIDGMVLLKDYINDPAKMVQPHYARDGFDEQKQILLIRLLSFIVDEENKECLLEVLHDRRDMSEGELSAVLANHLFSKLALNQLYTLDESYVWNIVCPCGCSTKIQHYGDTSFGNLNVWHGNADILLNESSVAVVNLAQTYSSEGKDSGELEKDLEHRFKKRIQNQLTSRTISFSFLQAGMHPEYMNKMIPCIGITYSEVIIYMYDSVKDVFVQSCALDLFEADKRQIKTSTIIAVWLAVNYKLFSSFSSSVLDFVETLPHANFHEVAKDKLHIYQKDVKLGSIGSPLPAKLWRWGNSKMYSHLKGSEILKSLGIIKD